MVKPPEVTIKENEEGAIVRQECEDTDELALYKTMRETLVYLTHLNPENMDRQMCARLSAETAHAQNPNMVNVSWSPTQLNRLCWAIG